MFEDTKYVNKLSLEKTSGPVGSKDLTAPATATSAEESKKEYCCSTVRQNQITTAPTRQKASLGNFLKEYS